MDGEHRFGSMFHFAYRIGSGGTSWRARSYLLVDGMSAPCTFGNMNTISVPATPLADCPPFRIVDHLPDQKNLLLFTGDDARPVEAALLARLEAVRPGSVLPVDFTSVRVASEAVRQLLRRAIKRIVTDAEEGRFIVLDHLSHSRYNVDVTLRGEGLTAVERLHDGTSARLLGQIDPAVRETYLFALAQGEVRAKDVLEHFELAAISTATNRLANLAKLGLAYRTSAESIAGGGRQYVYAAVK